MPFGRPRWVAQVTPAPRSISQAQRRDHRADAEIVGDDPPPAVVSDRHVEVDADEDRATLERRQVL